MWRLIPNCCDKSRERKDFCRLLLRLDGCFSFDGSSFSSKDLFHLPTPPVRSIYLTIQNPRDYSRMFFNVFQLVPMHLFEFVLGLIDGTTSVLRDAFFGFLFVFSLKRVPSSLTFPGCNIPGIGGGGGSSSNESRKWRRWWRSSGNKSGKWWWWRCRRLYKFWHWRRWRCRCIHKSRSGGGGGAADFIKSGTGGVWWSN